ncbi:hypothetical protein ABFS83_06G137300 [Erythranthe nasuta]
MIPQISFSNSKIQVTKFLDHVVIIFCQLLLSHVSPTSTLIEIDRVYPSRCEKRKTKDKQDELDRYMKRKGGLHRFFYAEEVNNIEIVEELVNKDVNDNEIVELENSTVDGNQEMKTT